MICCPPIRPPVPSAGGPHRPPRFAQLDICLASKHLVNGSCLENAISAPDSAIGARLGACTGSSACVCVGSPRRRGWLSRHVVHAARHSSVSWMDRAVRVPLKGLVGPPRDAATMPRLESVGSRAVSGRWGFADGKANAEQQRLRARRRADLRGQETWPRGARRMDDIDFEWH